MLKQVALVSLISITKKKINHVVTMGIDQSSPRDRSIRGIPICHNHQNAVKILYRTKTQERLDGLTLLRVRGHPKGAEIDLGVRWLLRENMIRA